LFTSGAMSDGVPPTYPTATGVAEAGAARRAVDQRAVVGTDLLKIYTKITPSLLKPLMDEASTLRLAVAAHLGKTDAITAARAGVASLEHMAGVVQAAVRDPAPYFKAHDQFLSGWTLEEAGWAALDSGSVQRVARAVAATRTAVVPTLVLHEMLARLDNPTLLLRPGMEDVPASAAGEAITAATRKGAPPLHAHSLGRLAAGKVAALVVLDGDAVTTIAATRRIAWVMIRGRIIQPDSLRKTWAK